MNRRSFIQCTALGTTLASAVHAAGSAAAESSPSVAVTHAIRPFEHEEATIDDLQAAMVAGKASAVSLAAEYLRRIEEVDQNGPRLASVLEVNPDALAIAKELDEERQTAGPRGPLHGIPVL